MRPPSQTWRFEEMMCAMRQGMRTRDVRIRPDSGLQPGVWAECLSRLRSGSVFDPKQRCFKRKISIIMFLSSVGLEWPESSTTNDHSGIC